MTSGTAGRSAVTSPARRIRSARVVRVLEHDPELGEGLDSERLDLAIARLQAAVLRLPRGSWEPTSWPDGVRHGIGLLVLDGLVLRQVETGGRIGAELLAAGDLLRPWQREDSIASVPRHPGWRALERTRLAVLDLEFARRLAPFPEVQGELVARALRRSRQLAVNVAIVHQPRVEARVEMMLWQLADRFGTVSNHGVLLPLRLTHTLIAELVAARRPTVSAAISALERSGELSRPADGGWLLHGSPPGASS
jgi:CRP/FNR family transcriptional regulator, cyclic AMP receptor protein